MSKLSDEDRRRSFTDPVAFQETWLRRRLWQKQREIAHSIQVNDLTAVKGCHASGKTYLASGLPLHWLISKKQGKVFTTAPTLRQVKMFWEEISLARRQSRLASILPECSTTGLKINEERYAIGASSSRGVNVQGFHGQDVLVIADEAPGIEADIWDAIEGIRAGGRVRVLKMGNPVVPSGEFFDAFHRGRGIHNCISISAFDTPNLQNEVTGKALTFEELVELPEERLNYAPIPYLITRRWVLDRYKAWGPNHPKFRSRVMAEFPTQGSNTVFELAWIEKAKRDPSEKDLEDAKKYKIQVGIDVAGAGSDETVLTARVNGIIIEQHVWPDADPRGGVVIALGRLKHHALYRLGMVVVDTVGIGYNFALHLADQGFPVHGFIAGARPMDGEHYQNQKAETHFLVREYFKAGMISGLNDEETEAQLSTILYRENSNGKTEIIPKEEMLKKHNVPSPDRAESLVMAFMRVVPRQQTVAPHGYEVSISPI